MLAILAEARPKIPILDFPFAAAPAAITDTPHARRSSAP
jgi:hypothetical protein